jgi:hypothetical protein
MAAGARPQPRRAPRRHDQLIARRDPLPSTCDPLPREVVGHSPKPPRPWRYAVAATASNTSAATTSAPRVLGSARSTPHHDYADTFRQTSNAVVVPAIEDGRRRIFGVVPGLSVSNCRSCGSARVGVGDHGVTPFGLRGVAFCAPRSEAPIGRIEVKSAQLSLDGRCGRGHHLVRSGSGRRWRYGGHGCR